MYDKTSYDLFSKQLQNWGWGRKIFNLITELTEKPSKEKELFAFDSQSNNMQISLLQLI